MITIKPMEQSDKKDEILSLYRNQGAFEIIVMKDGSYEIATSVIAINGDTLNILSLDLRDYMGGELSQNQRLLVDFLIKGIASYAENHGVDYISAKGGSFDSVFVTMGFEENGRLYTAPVCRFVRKTMPKQP